MSKTGFIRKFSKIIFFLLFSFFLTSLIFSFFLFRITTYENSKNIFVSIFSEVVNESVVEKQKVERFYEDVQRYCSYKKEEHVSLPNNITIKCSDVLDTNSSYLILIAEKSFEKIYYKNYECEMIECLKQIKSTEDFTLFVSLKSNEFFKKITILSFVFTVVFSSLLFISIETWESRAKVFGLEFFSIGVFYFFLPIIKNFLLRKFHIGYVDRIFSLILNELTKIFLFFFSLGLALICVWVFTKFYFKKSK